MKFTAVPTKQPSGKQQINTTPPQKKTTMEKVKAVLVEKKYPVATLGIFFHSPASVP